ncbi:hypothetical protein HOY82DRAFT_543680 [Tuber indicum]|nr:hypothetical protein HOY82DRAFT_543680 [Tuber indicum]
MPTIKKRTCQWRAASLTAGRSKKIAREMDASSCPMIDAEGDIIGHNKEQSIDKEKKTPCWQTIWRRKKRTEAEEQLAKLKNGDQEEAVISEDNIASLVPGEGSGGQGKASILTN